MIRLHNRNSLVGVLMGKGKIAIKGSETTDGSTGVEYVTIVIDVVLSFLLKERLFRKSIQ